MSIERRLRRLASRFQSAGWIAEAERARAWADQARGRTYPAAQRRRIEGDIAQAERMADLLQDRGAA